VKVYIVLAAHAQAVAAHEHGEWCIAEADSSVGALRTITRAVLSMMILAFNPPQWSVIPLDLCLG